MIRTILGVRYGGTQQPVGPPVKELTALRLPPDLVVLVRQRMRLEHKTKTDVLIDAIYKGLNR